jgi:lipopolysaccharide/colanic/teichoic acid biosynthesis glycosyltransferase
LESTEVAYKAKVAAKHEVSPAPGGDVAEARDTTAPVEVREDASGGFGEVADLSLPGWFLRAADRSAPAGPAHERLKRGIDVMGAAAALVLVAPLCLLCIAMIKLDSPGPIFFAQERTGRHGRRFRMYKFRTMVADAEARKHELASRNERQWPDFKICHDPRVTKVGHVLRRLSVDELPQFWNVLKGDMSLVGPRPTSFLASDFAEWQHRRFDVLPGLTGVWQVFGRNEECFDVRCRLDNFYVTHRSLMLDLYLLVMTVALVFCRPSGR